MCRSVLLWCLSGFDVHRMLRDAKDLQRYAWWPGYYKTGVRCSWKALLSSTHGLSSLDINRSTNGVYHMMCVDVRIPLSCSYR